MSSKFIDKYEIREAGIDALTTGVKLYVKNATASALTEQVATLIRDAGPEIVSAFFGSVTGSCLRMILGVQNRVASNVAKLVRAPFQTGIRAAQESLTLNAATEAEQSFRIEHLRFATEELGRALSLVDEGTEEEIYIKFVQGLCYREVPGALSLARKRLSEVVDFNLKSIPPETMAYFKQFPHKMPLIDDTIKNSTEAILDGIRRAQHEKHRKTWVFIQFIQLLL